METIILAAGRRSGIFSLIQKALEGDTESQLVLLGIVALLILIVFLQKLSVRQRGKSLAKALGEGAFFDSSPGGGQIWSIAARHAGLDFQIDGLKEGKEQKTALVFSLPEDIAWSQVAAYLEDSAEGLINAEVEEYPGEINIKFPGLGGDADFVRTLFSEVQGAVRRLAPVSV